MSPMLTMKNSRKVTFLVFYGIVKSFPIKNKCIFCFLSTKTCVTSFTAIVGAYKFWKRELRLQLKYLPMMNFINNMNMKIQIAIRIISLVSKRLFSKNSLFLIYDMSTYVCVSGGKKCYFFATLCVLTKMDDST